MNNIIYLDNAATTSLDENAFEAMKPYLLNDFANPASIYQFASKSREAVENGQSAIERAGERLLRL